MSALVFDRVQVGFPTVIDDYSLTVAPGEVVVLSGGIGKYLLLRLALGMIRATAGTVRTLALDPAALGPTDLRRLRSRCALLPHTGALVSNLSIRANIELPLRYHSTLTGVEIAGRVDAVLEALEIAHLANLRPSAMTYLEQRLAALARARVSCPELLLAQDPYEGMEREMRARVGRLLDDFTKQGCALLITTPVVELDAAHDGRLGPAAGVRVIRHQGLQSPPVASE